MHMNILTDSFKESAKGFLEESLHLLFPRVCPVCGQILTEKNRHKNPFICNECYQKLHFPSGPRCHKCSRLLVEERAKFCPGCRKRRLCFDRGISLLMHDDAAKEILYSLKFSNKRENADMLAWEAAERCEEIIKFWNPEVLIPVPLSARKKQIRGFNQTELLARKTAWYLKQKGILIPVDGNYLFRERNTLPQKDLNRKEREKNLRGAFRVHPEKSTGRIYRNILLIDDIYTTGSTLSECAKALRKAHAEKICFLTFSIV